jgi:hypothetical protein
MVVVVDFGYHGTFIFSDGILLPPVHHFSPYARIIMSYRESIFERDTVIFVPVRHLDWNDRHVLRMCFTYQYTPTSAPFLPPFLPPFFILICNHSETGHFLTQGSNFFDPLRFVVSTKLLLTTNQNHHHLHWITIMTSFKDIVSAM